MNLQKYYYLILLIFVFGCEKDDEKVEIETEKIVNGRILFSADNQVPENLKVLSLDGITELGINTNLNLPSSINELEFLLTEDNQLLFARKKHPNVNDAKLSSESTVLFLCTYNSAYYELDESNKGIIINQIVNNPNFISAKNILDNSSFINLNDDDFKQKIQSIITEIYSIENLNTLSRNQMPLEELTTIYTAFDDKISIKNNSDIHVGFSITKDGNQIEFGVLDGQEEEEFTYTEVNSIYHIKSMSGADISGVFNDNDLEEIEAFNADFRQFLKDSSLILLQLALPELVTECFDPIFETAIEGIDFAEQYGNNNEASAALIEAFIDLIPSIEEIIIDGAECVNQGSNNVLAEILEVFNIINDIVNTANFLNNQLNTISDYIYFENSEYDCYYKVETVFYECDNPNNVGSPSGPVPNDNATGVPVNGTFSFSLGDNTPDYAAFKIYTGQSTNLTNAIISNSTFNQYPTLQEGTTYYWKVEVINPATDLVLATSNTWSFTTSGTSNTTPTLSTNSITNITQTSASSGGNITSDGGSNITAKGICWSTNSNPTINNNSNNVGTGTDNFSSSMTNLNSNTTYYVKAYATNSEGTGYGNEIEFTTTDNNNISIISLSGDLNFGNVQINQSDTRILQISNAGLADFNISSITSPDGFTVEYSGPVLAEDFVNVPVTFSPTNEQYYNGSITVNSNADSGGANIDTSGTGINNSGAPILEYVENRVDDNNSGDSSGNDDEIIDAGEIIEFDVRLQNTGNATANNVSAILQTNDSDINITDNSASFGNISNGDLDWNSGEFLFEVNDDCPTKTVDFTLNITSDEGNWQQNFSINVQGSSGGNPISITPADDDCSAPLMQINQEYEININVSSYGSAIPIDGESSGGGNVRGFWLSFYVPSGTTVNDVKIYDVSNNFDPVIGTRTNCTFTNYLPDITTTNYYDYANQNGIGDNETFRNNFVGDSGSNNDGVYYVRIYHYYGNETPNISFKMIVE